MVAVFFVALVLLGCRNSLDPQDVEGDGTEGSSSGTGTLLLTINRQGLGRTILPEIALDNFVRFDLYFVDNYDDGISFGKSWTYDTLADGYGTVDLIAGGLESVCNRISGWQ